MSQLLSLFSFTHGFHFSPGESATNEGKACPKLHRWCDAVSILLQRRNEGGEVKIREIEELIMQRWPEWLLSDLEWPEFSVSSVMRADLQPANSPVTKGAEMLKHDLTPLAASDCFIFSSPPPPRPSFRPHPVHNEIAGRPDEIFTKKLTNAWDKDILIRFDLAACRV